MRHKLFNDSCKNSYITPSATRVSSTHTGGKTQLKISDRFMNPRAACWNNYIVCHCPVQTDCTVSSLSSTAWHRSRAVKTVLVNNQNFVKDIYNHRMKGFYEWGPAEQKKKLNKLDGYDQTGKVTLLHTLTTERNTKDELWGLEPVWVKADTLVCDLVWTSPSLLSPVPSGR